MDFTSGLTIGRVRGIEIRIHWSWLIIFALLTWSLAEGLFGTMFEEWSDEQLWFAAVVTSLLFFLSVLIHELGHAFVAQGLGIQVPMITLFVFGGVSSMGEEMRSAGQEFRVAVAGPLTSWGLAVLFGAVWFVLQDFELNAIFGYLAVINFVLGLFNLLPGFPLDGGRVFRSLVWARTKDLVRATRVASQVGMGLAWVMIALGLVNVFVFGLLGGIWYVLIGLFLRAASQGSYQMVLVDRALRYVRAHQVMRQPSDPIPADMPLRDLVEERVLGSSERAFLVRRDGAVVGLVTVSDIVRVPREEWERTPASEVMVPAKDVATVEPNTPLIEAMRTLQERDVHQLPVLEDGRLVGMVTRGDVMQQIEFRVRFEDGTD